MKSVARLVPVIVLCARAAAALDDAGAARALAFARQQLAAEAARIPATQSPAFTQADGTWATVANTDLTNWVQGFYPGANWYLFDLLGDAAAKDRADRWTRALELQKTNTQTHDLGFKLYLSFGHAFRSTGDTYYRDVLLVAARSLATRYDAAVGAVICCDWNPAWHRPTVVDTMMNLELLLWGAANGGDASWRDMAVNHALKTLADMVRPDGSTYHVVDYAADGTVLSRGTLQGYSDSSTWTRGQAWAIYGFTTVYRYTHDPRMLAAAQKTADFYLARLGADPVPNWDFDAPSQHKDSSAAAAVAAALYELRGYVDPAAAQRYLAAANRMLDALASPAYLAQGTPAQSVLLHGVGNLPSGEQVDVGLVYGDYYFLEALARRPADAAADGGTADAGTVDGGMIDAGPIDGGVPLPAPHSSGCSSTGPGFAFAAAALVAFLRRSSRPV